MMEDRCKSAMVEVVFNENGGGELKIFIEK